MRRIGRQIVALALATLGVAGVAGCGGASGELGGGSDGGSQVDFGPPHGTIDPNGGGGSVNLLAFTSFGDIRPAIPDVVVCLNDYPTLSTGITPTIFSGMDALNPEFAVGSGDYMFVQAIGSLGTSCVDQQLTDLLQAEQGFHHPIFHGMGNHECNSFCDSNCPNLNEYPNASEFMRMIDTFTQVPYYSFVIHTDLGDAKFLFLADNAWTDNPPPAAPGEAQWLDTALSQKTRYTFIVQHHPTPDAGKTSNAPGIAPSNTIIQSHAADSPVTLYLYGHVHEYTHLTDSSGKPLNAVVSGNAGAPLDSGDYGWVYVLQRPDGNISVTAYKYDGSPIENFVVTPDGQVQ
jgi:hypothetical protein